MTDNLKNWRKKNPDKVREQNKRSYVKHKTEINKRCKEYYITNKDYRREIMYYKKYNLKFGEYDKKVFERNGLCDICKSIPVTNKKRLVVDHCHITGKIRGLLCDDCNQGIGRLKDNIDLLKSSLMYLEKYNG